ncbi:LANO_0E00276g1_1 [Lachancea nothofagi CBS 11611]|uniref:LANO_0E00276g1_1 n=1 Tax=Lachancea nothofagi CBS 11611 TaxID=1266666 RepID=A0A1G4JNM6_9SACH|nr:LANO_0E00276g1_1 [Lachancea nothofagi CBS 11611]
MRRAILIFCIASLCMALFLGALDIVICITLYDTIGEKFKDYSNVGWIMTGYNLPNALFMLLWGRLASILGLKSSLVISIVIFELGSLLAAVANSMGMLIGARVIAGFAGSGIESLVFAVGTSMVGEKHRARVITILGIAYMIAEGVGPFIGGAFAEHVSWRWCFYVNLPIGGLALAVLSFGYNPAGNSPQSAIHIFWRKVRHYQYRRILHREFWFEVFVLFFFKLDIVGLIFSSTGFALIMLALTFGGTKFAWNSGSIITMFTVGISLLVLFLVYDFIIFPWIGRQSRQIAANPLVSWRLGSNMGILTSSMAGFFNCFAFELQSIFIVQYYQLVVNKGPTLASIHLWQMSVPALVSVIVCAFVNEKFGIVKPLMVMGATFGFIGSGLLTMMDSNTRLGGSIGYSMLAGASFGAVYQMSLLSSQLQVDYKDVDFHVKFIEVTAYNTFLKTLGFAFAGIVSTTIFGVSLRNLTVGATGIPHFADTEEIISYRNQHFDGRNSELGQLLAKSIRSVFLFALGCSALSFIFSLFTSSKRTMTSDAEEDVSIEHKTGV